LHNRSLLEACETLFDIYKYQDAPDAESTDRKPQLQVVNTSKPLQIGRIW
jgi:hypothetical protein